MSKLADRNFDSLMARFERSIYSTQKGDLRLKLLKEDLQSIYNTETTQTIWDAGCGLGQISCWLAEKGHRITLCDISEQMLTRAKNLFAMTGHHGEFFHEPAQSLSARLPLFDLVLLHAVVEWLAEPIATLKTIADRVKPGGHLSLMFYNLNATVYTNVLKGEWRWRHLLDNHHIGKGKRLTPPNPQFPHELVNVLSDCGFEIKMHTGIRVFHDYIRKDIKEKGDSAELLELEYRYCRLPTYRDMGRYVHLLAQRVP